MLFRDGAGAAQKWTGSATLLKFDHMVLRDGCFWHRYVGCSNIFFSTGDFETRVPKLKWFEQCCGAGAGGAAPFCWSRKQAKKISVPEPGM
jgi:hypothetical protein